MCTPSVCILCPHFFHMAMGFKLVQCPFCKVPKDLSLIVLPLGSSCSCDPGAGTFTWSLEGPKCLESYSWLLRAKLPAITGGRGPGPSSGGARAELFPAGRPSEPASLGRKPGAGVLGAT